MITNFLKNPKIGALFLGILFAAGLGFIWRTKEGGNLRSKQANTADISAGWVLADSDKQMLARTASDAVNDKASTADSHKTKQDRDSFHRSTAKADTKNTKEYINDDYGFSLRYPANMKVTEVEDVKGDVVFFQNEAGDTFQIFIMPFDESGPITPARIKRDLPNFLIENPQEAVIGEGRRVLIFWTRNSAGQRMREVWFVYDDALYQIESTAGFDKELAKIMSTFRFE